MCQNSEAALPIATDGYDFKLAYDFNKYMFK